MSYGIEKEMDKKEREEILESLKEFCYIIGCSGMDKKCPGNPNCKIVRKVFLKKQ